MADIRPYGGDAGQRSLKCHDGTRFMPRCHNEKIGALKERPHLMVRNEAMEIDLIRQTERFCSMANGIVTRHVLTNYVDFKRDAVRS